MNDQTRMLSKGNKQGIKNNEKIQLRGIHKKQHKITQKKSQEISQMPPKHNRMERRTRIKCKSQ